MRDTCFVVVVSSDSVVVSSVSVSVAFEDGDIVEVTAAVDTEDDNPVADEDVIDDDDVFDDEDVSDDEDAFGDEDVIDDEDVLEDEDDCDESDGTDVDDEADDVDKTSEDVVSDGSFVGALRRSKLQTAASVFLMSSAVQAKPRMFLWRVNFSQADCGVPSLGTMPINVLHTELRSLSMTERTWLPHFWSLSLYPGSSEAASADLRDTGIDETEATSMTSRETAARESVQATG